MREVKPGDQSDNWRHGWKDKIKMMDEGGPDPVRGGEERKMSWPEVSLPVRHVFFFYRG